MLAFDKPFSLSDELFYNSLRVKCLSCAVKTFRFCDTEKYSGLVICDLPLENTSYRPFWFESNGVSNALKWRLQGVCKEFAKRLERVWKGFAKHLEGVCEVFESIWKGFVKRLKGVCKAFEMVCLRVCRLKKRVSTKRRPKTKTLIFFCSNKARTVKKLSQSVPRRKQMWNNGGLHFVQKTPWIYKTKTLTKTLFRPQFKRNQGVFVL